MTRAPDNLLTVRRLLLDHLNVEPTRVRPDDLEPAEVGIVGDAAHRGGYHTGSDRVVPNDYSVVESPRDRSGLTENASALDVGMFRVHSAGRTHDLFSFSTWCVQQCVAGTPDSRDIREIIYSPDGRVVRRWDRLKRRSTGDSSHLWHTHFSFFRDAIKDGHDLTPLFRRYLTTIGLAAGSTGGMDDMFCRRGDQGPAVEALQRLLIEIGFNPGPVDSKYGDMVTAALSAARKAAGNQVTSGDSYTPAAYVTLQVLLARRHAGQPGRDGTDGKDGVDGRDAVVDYRLLAQAAITEAAAHLVQGQARE